MNQTAGIITMTKIIRQTRSVCPVCLKNLPAHLSETDGVIYLEKVCPEHGHFQVPVWRNQVDFDLWTKNAAVLAQGSGCYCIENCGLCQEHEAGSCCVLLEVTSRCNLRCKFCFADAGRNTRDPSLEELKAAISDIAAQCAEPLLQLSGGEPTLRDDLPALIRHAKESGCGYVQLNTNGIRLAQDKEFTAQLAEAGLDIVFLQFDGTDDTIYNTLRGEPLLDTKRRAISNCGENHIGVTLVPTVVRGVNDQHLGEIVHFASELVPVVRGVHFQPVSYFGRYPNSPGQDARYTLDELMRGISDQAGISLESYLPSRCDHPLCGFHANFLVNPDGSLHPLTSISQACTGRSTAKQNREYVARHWRSAPSMPKPAALSDVMDFDTFLYRLRHRSLSLSAMAFQDAMNLNIERLHRCSLHVYHAGRIKPFCANYLTSMEE